MAVKKSWTLENIEEIWTTKISDSGNGLTLFVMDSTPVPRGTVPSACRILQVKIDSLDQVDSLITALERVVDEARKMRDA